MPTVRIPILRFGMPLADGEQPRANLASMCKSLGYFLGTIVREVVVSNHFELLDQLKQGRVDLAWLPPVVAMEADSAGLARPRIAMVRAGETRYYSTLFTTRGSGIRTIADLKGARGAWVNPHSASGYLVPMASLRARGVSLSAAFSHHDFAGSHAAVARRLLDGAADVGATFIHFESEASRVIRSSGWIEAGLDANFHIITVAGPIPTDVIAFHRGVSSEHVREVTAGFRALIADPQAADAARALFATDGFAPCASSHLGALGKLIRLLDRSSAPATRPVNNS